MDIAVDVSEDNLFLTSKKEQTVKIQNIFISNYRKLLYLNHQLAQYCLDKQCEPRSALLINVYGVGLLSGLNFNFNYYRIKI